MKWFFYCVIITISFSIFAFPYCQIRFPKYEAGYKNSNIYFNIRVKDSPRFLSRNIKKRECIACLKRRQAQKSIVQSSMSSCAQSNINSSESLASFDIQSHIIASLQAGNPCGVRMALNQTKDLVFENAACADYSIPFQVEQQIDSSINIATSTKDAYEFAFHVTVVEHVLTDIQAQVNPDQSLMSRAPELLARALKTYISHLNPVTQVKNIASFVADTACFVSDVTLGKLYLSPEQYQERIDGFWQTIDAMRPENLAQLTAEQWVDLAAQFAADMTFGVGLGKTIKYLKHIDTIGRTQRQAAKVANKLVKAVDVALSKNPVVITAEGIPIRIPSDKLAGLLQRSKNKVNKVITDAKGMLKNRKILKGSKSRAEQIIGKYGKYQDAPYHGKVGNVIKSKAPIDGQRALNNSLSIRGVNSPHRIAISNGEFVVLSQTSPGLFHGHVRSWEQLNIYMQNTLKKAGLVTKKGKIIK